MTKVFITTQRITGELFLAAKFDQLQPNIGFGDAQRWALLAQGTRTRIGSDWLELKKIIAQKDGQGKDLSSQLI